MSEKTRVRVPNPDRFLARTTTEKMLCAAGVPAHFWGADPNKVKYKGTTVRGKKLSATAAKSHLIADVKEPPRRQPIVAISSQPTDMGALYLAYGLLTTYAKLHVKPTAIVNVGEELPFFYDYPHLVLVHNILDKATPERVERVRDAILRFPVAFRVIVLSGVANPEKWMATRVGVYPDLVVRVADMTKHDMVAE